MPYYILAYPNKQLAKAYYRQEGKYRKLADYTRQVSEFRVGDCCLKIDFSSVWR